MKKILAVSAAVSMAAMTAVVAEAATATQAELSVVVKDSEVNGVKAGETITATIITDNDGATKVDFSIKVTGLEMQPVTFDPNLKANQSGNEFSVTFNNEFKKGDLVCVIEFKVTDPNNMSIEIVPKDGTTTGSVPTWKKSAQTTESSSSDTNSSSDTENSSTDNSSSDNSSNESSTDNSSNESSTETSSTTTSAESSSTDSNKSDTDNVDTGVAGFAVMSVVLLAGASVVLTRKK